MTTLKQDLEARRDYAAKWGPHLMLVPDLLQAIETGEPTVYVPAGLGTTNQTTLNAEDLDSEVVYVGSQAYLRREGQFLLPLPFSFEKMNSRVPEERETSAGAVKRNSR